MIVGISLPLYSVAFGPHAAEPINWLDILAIVLGLTGILTAYVADNQLRDYMMENERRVAAGEPKELLLNSGLWHYSRHPNYFGEQLWWWSFAMFSVRVGQPWALAGTIINSLTLATVTCMTEAKVLREWPEERAALFRKYQQSTSACIPWFPSAQNSETIPLVDVNKSRSS